MVVDRIYTDGACSGNPGPGGWGVVIYFADGARHELGGSATHTTNNRMELQAAIAGLQFVHQLPEQLRSVSIYTDSEYVKKGITQWLAGWKRKDWKTAKGQAVLNQDLWQQLDQLNRSWIDWHYVKAHAGHEGNERCDTIARAFSLGQTPTLTQAELPVAPEFASDLADLPQNSLLSSSEAGASEVRKSVCLHPWFQALRVADQIATHGYLINSAELADLINTPASTIANRGDQWVWRNWMVSQVTRNHSSILWKLERVDDSPA